MSQTAKTVARQASFLMTASTLQKVIAFLAFTYAARQLGAEGVGTYFYVLSLSSLAAAWTDLGFTPVIIRAFSGSEGEGWRLVFSAVRAKLLLIPLAAAAALIYAWQFGGATVSLLPFLGLALLVMAEDAFSLLGYGILRGRQRLDVESLGMVLGQSLSSGLLVLAVWAGWGVGGALGALVCGSAWHVLWSAWWIRKIGGIPSDVPSYPWKKLFHLAWPFALAGIFVRVYSSVDSLLLNYWHGSGVVGQYAVAYKMTYALQFLPLAFVAALYPALSAAFAREDERALVHTALGSWRFMALLGFPLAAALSGFAPRLLPWLYGTHFVEAVPILAILAWVLPPIFLDFPIGSYLNATHRARQKTVSMGITMVVNAVCNLLLVPVLGGVGAAWSAVIGFVLLLLVSGWYARTVFFSRTALSVAGRGLILGGVVWLVIRTLLTDIPLVIALGLAPLTALALAIILQLIRRDDLVAARDWVDRRTKPV